MPQAIRQTNLFLAEDWTVIYKSYSQINFSSYDFDTIRASLIEYIRLNYPEDYNDWIESSEFVALIDLMAYLGQSIAFRMDLNTRENFLDTVENMESALRLARMLSYSPQRNYPASGLVKVTQVQTDEPIIDSENRNLSGVPIVWNAMENPDWLEQFTLVMNSALNSTNQFGTPVKSGTVNNIKTDVYEVNSVRQTNITYPFRTSVNGVDTNFEITKADIGENRIEEAIPSPQSAFSMLYRNDNRGNNSPSTGFFLMFKQGTLNFEDISLTVPVENLIYDLNNNNINETDVWLHEINEDGNIISEWVNVPTVSPSSNLIYNNINRNVRDIFSVITRQNDQISLKFADGNFGNVPTGFFRIWFRTSNGLQYSVTPQDIQNFTVSIPYNNAMGQTYTLTMTYSLQESISNSIPSETLEQIKERAPIVYYTQDRMVNGEDYNVFPLVRSGDAQKIKAVNRTYSGHSRFVDINDPTSTFQNTTVFSDDGMFYKEYDTKLTEVTITSSLTTREVVNSYIEQSLQNTSLLNFIYDSGTRGLNFTTFGSNVTKWNTATQQTASTTGWFTQNGSIRIIGTGTPPDFNLITEGSLINMVREGSDEDGIWVKVASVTDNGNGANPNGTGKVIIDERIMGDDMVIKQVLPSFSTTFTDTERSNIQSQVDLRSSFGLGFDYVSKIWYIIEPQDLSDLNSTYSTVFARNKSGSNIDASWIVRVEYTGKTWRIYTRGLDYIWESVKDVRFFYADDFKALSNETGKSVQDQINILKSNSQPDNGKPLDKMMTMGLDDTYTYPDGYIEPRRVKLSFYDSDADGSPDDPDVFTKVVGTGEFLFWKNYTSYDGYEYRKPTEISDIRTNIPTETTALNGDMVFVYDETDLTVGIFYEFDGEDKVWVDVSSDYEFNPNGRRNLYFNWKHYASREDRIDPAITNIIDMFVMTSTYDSDIRRWINQNGRRETKPQPPTSDNLTTQFSDMEDFKMISDEIIWRPTSYKVLFGSQAEEELQARFKVVKVAGSNVSDNEIKSRIIRAIDEYFQITNWNFGETFYMSEMAAFIHQKMATVVASIVLVPLNEESAFGNLYQVNSETNELFISAAKVTDIDIVDNLTPNNLRIGN